MRTPLSVLACLLLLLGPAAADDEKPKRLTSKEAADEAVAAVEAKDKAALEALGAADAPDPWVVADILCERGADAAALAFGKAAATRTATRALLAAIKAQQKKKPKAARAAIEAFRAAAKKSDWAAAVAAGEVLEDAPVSIALVRFEYERARVLAKLRRAREAEQLFLRMAAKAHEIGWFVWERKSFHEAGFAAHDDRRPADAIAHWKRAVTVLERLDEQYTLGNTLSNMAIVSRRMGRLDDAFEHSKRSVAVWEKQDEPGQLSDALSVLGSVHSQVGRVEEAAKAYERSIRAAEDAKDPKRTADGLVDWAGTHKSRGRLADARRALKRASEIFARIGDRKGEARALDESAGIEAELGNTSEAFRRFDKALAIYEDLKHGSAGHVRLMRGGLYQKLGDLARASTDYERGLAIARQIRDRRMEAYFLTNMGMVTYLQQEHARSLARYQEALEVAEAIQDRRLVGHLHGRMGDVSREMKDYAKAEAHAAKALEIIEPTGDTSAIAQAHNSIGATLLYQGRYQEALPHYTRSHELLRDSHVTNTYLWTLWGLGECSYADGKWKAALAYAREAVGVIESIVERLGEHGGAVARDVWRRIYWVGLRAAAWGKDAEQLAWFMESSRAGSLRESLANREALQGALIPAALLAEEKAARAATAMASADLAAARRTGKLASVRAAKKALEAARKRQDDVVEKIQREAKVGAAVLYPQPDDLKTIRARLASDQALILYALTEPDADATALVVRRKSARIVPLGKSKDLEEAAAALKLEQKGEDATAVIARLRALLVEPLELAKDVKRVLVSPAGRVGYVPLSVLLPEREVAYVPSGTAYGLLVDAKGPKGEGVLAVGDPDYGTLTDKAVLARHRGDGGPLLPLPATREEVNAIGTAKLLGRQATEAEVARVLGTAPRWRAVHFACHGLINAAAPQFSSLALTADEANDGFLSTLEIYRMRMPADLVVLSACETARGRVLQNEGIMGFTQAFFVSGASRVLCSLWKVDDEATRALMVKFYELWKDEGLAAAAALKQAQAHVRTLEVERPDPEASRKAGRTVTKKVRPWAHPYYWAAWVLWGLPD